MIFVVVDDLVPEARARGAPLLSSPPVPGGLLSSPPVPGGLLYSRAVPAPPSRLSARALRSSVL